MSGTLLVCGSRTHTNTTAIRTELLVEQPDLVLTGDAKGADTHTKETCDELGIPCVVFKARWDLYGRKAGPIRNLVMLDENPDRVLAFHDGTSPGTLHTITEAKKRGIPVRILNATQ